MRLGKKKSTLLPTEALSLFWGFFFQIPGGARHRLNTVSLWSCGGRNPVLEQHQSKGCKNVFFPLQFFLKSSFPGWLQGLAEHLVLFYQFCPVKPSCLPSVFCASCWSCQTFPPFWEALWGSSILLCFQQKLQMVDWEFSSRFCLIVRGSWQRRCQTCTYACRKKKKNGKHSMQQCIQSKQTDGSFSKPDTCRHPNTVYTLWRTSTTVSL